VSGEFDDRYSEQVTERFSEGSGVSIDDFRAYMPTHAYLFTPCREIWAAPSVNARVPPVPVLDKHGQPQA
jgi:hypothetical protein